MRPAFIATALVTVLLAPIAAHAQLNGASVNGTMWIDGDHTTNYFGACCRIARQICASLT
jgi:hypothetical protein